MDMPSRGDRAPRTSIPGDIEEFVLAQPLQRARAYGAKPQIYTICTKCCFVSGWRRQVLRHAEYIIIREILPRKSAISQHAGTPRHARYCLLLFVTGAREHVCSLYTKMMAARVILYDARVRLHGEPLLIRFAHALCALADDIIANIQEGGRAKRCPAPHHRCRLRHARQQHAGARYVRRKARAPRGRKCRCCCRRAHTCHHTREMPRREDTTDSGDTAIIAIRQQRRARRNAHMNMPARHIEKDMVEHVAGNIISTRYTRYHCRKTR